MRHSLPSSLIIFLSLCAVLVLGTGCSDDDPPSETRYLDYHAAVREQFTGDPVGGIKLLLMDASSNRPVAGPVVSQEFGEARFGVLPQGDYELLVLGGLEYMAASITEDVASGPTGNPGHSPVSPTAMTSPPPFRTFQVSLFRVATGDSLALISGKVVDAATGQPLDQVFVSLSPYLTGYEQSFSASDDVTLDDGRFTSYQVPFTVNPVSGNIAQVQPLRFTRAGYRPALYAEDPPNGHFDLEFRGALIAMERVGPEDTGSITGRLLRDGSPLAGAVVGVGVLDTTATVKAGPGMTGWTGMTDEEGVYRITGLPEGIYWLQPGFPVGDGVFFPNQENIEAATVTQGTEFTAKDLTVLHEIRPVTPAHGSFLTAPLDSLRWTAVPGAARYQIRFEFTDLPETTNNAAPFPAELLTDSGLYFWYVGAFNEEDDLLGVHQQSFRFTYEKPHD